MSILFNKVIMHTLDLQVGMPVLSKECLVLNDEVEAYITSYLVGLFESHSMAKTVFESNSPWQEIIKEKHDFCELSHQLARQFYAYMQTLENIPSGDLIVAEFKRDQIPYIAFFKLNYKEAYTHVIDHGVQANQIIKHKTIFPETQSKIQEAAIINLETYEMLLLDGHRERYLHTLLGAIPKLTINQKVRVVEKVITEAIEENYENKIEAVSFAKSNLAKSIDHTNSILIEEVLEETFGDNEQIKEACLAIFEEQGITDKAIDLQQASKVVKKYTSHKLKTNTGIEIKLPTDMLHDPNKIEFVTNPDGTLEVRIKNVATLINK